MTERSETPETDALVIPSEALLLVGQKGVPERIVEAILKLGEHARSLERRLQEALDRNDYWIVKLAECRQRAERGEKEGKK